jgi:hypothetical protein
MDPKDGCETKVLADPKNCGACGMTCPNAPHATNACINSQCVLTGCQQGFADCNNNPMDGCETVTGTDRNNCGACGNVCPQNLICQNSSCTCQQCNIPNAKSQCVNNQCVFASCLPGFGDCNNNTMDGCEVNFATDANNCGGCNMACPMNMPVCLNSMCTNLICHNIGYMNCPTGKTQVCDVKPIDGMNMTQAQLACQTCWGMNCVLQNGDCAGPGYCAMINGQQPCWGWQAGCSGAAGRVWQYGSSFTTYGMWAN